MFLKLAPMFLALCTYSSATNHHPGTIIKDVDHLGHHHATETKVIGGPLLPPPLLPFPKFPAILVKDFLNHKLPGHHLHEKEFELPKPILPFPPFPEVPIAKLPIFPPKPIAPPVLKPLPKLPLPPPPFVKKLPFPDPIGHHEPISPVVVKEPVIPVIKPIIPITKHHHVIPIHEHI